MCRYYRIGDASCYQSHATVCKYSNKHTNVHDDKKKRVEELTNQMRPDYGD